MDNEEARTMEIETTTDTTAGTGVESGSQMTFSGPWGTFDYIPPNNVTFPYQGGFGGTNLEWAGAPLTDEQIAALSWDLATVTIETDTPEAEVDTEPVRWQSVLAVEGKATQDNTPTPRIIIPGAMRWRELPIPLMALIKDEGGAHAGHALAGRIDEVWRVERPDLGEGVIAIMGRGVFDSSTEDESGEFGRMIARLVRERTLRGVSIDPVDVEWALVDAETLEPVDAMSLTADDLVRGRFYAAMTSGSISAATVCPMQAFEEATIEILVAAGVPTVTTAGEIEILEDEPLFSCAAGPIAPPASWFEKVDYRKLTPFFVTDEGQVGGHLQSRDCHVGYEDRCIRAPRSLDGYLRFHNGNMVTAEGKHIKIGHVQVKPHASRHMSIDEAIAYYSDPETVGAFVVIWDDEFGIACAGVTRSNASPELLRDFYANPPSGEWRRGELMGFSSVPLPGLPVVAPTAYIVASAAGEEEVEMLLLPGVSEEDLCEECEPTETDVLVAAAALQGDEALAALIAG